VDLLSKVKNSCADPPIAKVKPNPKPIFPSGPLSYSHAMGFPTDTKQFYHGILKKSNVSRPITLLILKCSK